MTTTSLLDWILSILRDPDQRAAFQHDPEDYARDHGFTDLSSADVHDALLLIGDNQSASYDHEHSVHYPPPQHYDNHEHAGHYLNHYITNNYKVIDDRDTNIDNSIHQKIDNRGGDFHQTVDNDTVVASGDHAVAAGGDIEHSNLATGDRAVAGEHNQVSGDHSSTAFGSGSATNASFDHAKFGDGSGVALGGGDASGHSEDNDSTTSVRGGHGDTSVNTVGSHSDARQETDQSEHDNSTHIHADDHHQSDSNNEVLSHDGHIEDVQHIL